MQGANYGTSGQVLTSQGSGAAPTWAAPAGAGTFNFVADGAITAGKAVILKSTGRVAQSAIAAASIGTAVDLSGNNATSVSTCYDPVNDKFVVFYRDASDGGRGKAVVGTVSGSSVSFGSPVTFFNSALADNNNNNIDSCYDPVTGQIIVAYSPASSNNLDLAAWTVSGTTLNSVSSLATGLQAFSLGVCYDTSVNRILIAHRNNSSQFATVVQNTGTSLVAGSTITVASGSINGYTSSAVHCQGHSTTGTNVVVYNQFGRAYFTPVIINPSTFGLSLGSTGVVSPGNGYAWGTKSIAWSSAYQRLLVLAQGGPDQNYILNVTMYSLSGTTPNYIGQFNVNGSFYSNPFQNFPSIACSPDGLSVCVVYPDAGLSNFGRLQFSAAFSGSSISFGSPLQYQSSNVGWTSVAYDSSGKILVGYSVTSGLGRAVVGAAPIPDSRTSFIGFAQNTVANNQTVTVTTPFGVNENQSGLTPDANYFLSASDGSTLTTAQTGPRVGKALSATKLLVLGSNVYQV